MEEINVDRVGIIDEAEFFQEELSAWERELKLEILSWVVTGTIC